MKLPPLFLNCLLLLLDLRARHQCLNRIELVSIRLYLHLIVTLAAEVEDRLSSGEIAVRVGGKAGRQA